MSSTVYNKKLFLKRLQSLSWFTLPIAERYFSEVSSKRIRELLKQLSEERKLLTEPFQGETAYLVRRLSKSRYIDTPGNVYHGVATSDIATRLLAYPGAKVVPKKFWWGQGIYPDTSILFSNGWFLPVEFATKEHSRLITVYKSKITRYLSLLQEKWQVLFVMDVDEQRLQYLVEQYTKHPSFFYISYTGFKEIPYGYHLTTPCYLNGMTLERVSLKETT